VYREKAIAQESSAETRGDASKFAGLSRLIADVWKKYIVDVSLL